MLLAKRRDARRRPFNQRFLSYRVEEHILKLPFIHVRMIGKSITLTTSALIDSGATTSFIPTGMASLLDLEVVEQNQEATGAGGDFMNDVCKFGVELLKGTQIMCRLEGEAHVPKEEGRVPYVVLGRDTLFEAYDITFRERRQMVVLRPAKPVH